MTDEYRFLNKRVADLSGDVAKLQIAVGLLTIGFILMAICMAL